VFDHEIAVASNRRVRAATIAPLLVETSVLIVVPFNGLNLKSNSEIQILKNLEERLL
jgi:hypothetical protein